MPSKCVYQFELNRYKIDEFRKHVKIICLILTSCDAKTVRRTSWRLGIVLIGIIVIMKILQPTRTEVSTTFGSKVMAQIVVLMFLVTLTYVLYVVTQRRHEVLESPCEVSYESVTH